MLLYNAAVNNLKCFTGDDMNRRSFLKVGAVGAAIPAAPLPALNVLGEEPAAPPEGEPIPRRDGVLPGIPESKDLASQRLVYEYSELFNPPPAQNEWGFCQATRSVAGLTSILFPPFACCGPPSIPTPGGEISPGNLITCDLFLNGRILSSYPLPEAKVAYTWSPHGILRETRAQGLRFITRTFVPARQRAVAEMITVRNESPEPAKVSLGFDLRAGVTYKEGPWYMGDPAEADNHLTANVSEGYIVFESRHSRAISVQGIHPLPQRIEQGRMLTYEFSLNPGEERDFQYVNVMGDDRAALLDAYTRRQADFRQSLTENEAIYNARIRAAFTPGNSEFSGSLPQLVTRDADLWKIYYAGFLDLFLARRVSSASVYGPTYITVPRGTSTLSYVWDTMLASLSMALLDPQALRSLLEVWFVAGMDEHYGTDYLSGKAMGPWYAANDLGILRCAHDYLRVTGDFQWLDKSIDGKIVLEHLADRALRWKQLDRFGHGLGDYGGMDNLLEAVSTYLHEVAAFNAANVYGMRFVAALLDRHGDSFRAKQYRSEAKDLAERINRLLYVEGKGWWKCGQSDGTFPEVRHCFDLLTVLDTMFEDLGAQQKKEMAEFFWTELHTPIWMHALSPGDADASWKPGASRGLRSDHTWIGAYLAWPPMTARGLYKIDSSARVAAWVRGFAKTAHQGTFGQAHFVETTFPPDAGGARKDPVGGWYEVAGGSFMNLVIDTIFGADLTLDSGIHVNSRLEDFDPSAQLVKLVYQGKDYTISRKGAQQTP
jgi:hypothetical protein